MDRPIRRYACPRRARRFSLLRSRPSPRLLHLHLPRPRAPLPILAPLALLCRHVPLAPRRQQTSFQASPHSCRTARQAGRGTDLTFYAHPVMLSEARSSAEVRSPPFASHIHSVMLSEARSSKGRSRAVEASLPRLGPRKHQPSASKL